MRICVLGSGSNGNCTLVQEGNTSILVDLGFGPQSLARRLNNAGLELTGIDAVLLTHGHGDHSGGIRSVARAWRMPIFMNSGTRAELPDPGESDRWEIFRTGEEFQVGDLSVSSFPISHDAGEPVGFRIRSERISGAVATDLGEVDPGVVGHLTDCNWLLLESNHDEGMLRVGPYPWHLKQRVRSRRGHLSNRELANFLSDDYDGSASHIFLAHLSRKNNDPEIALHSARNALLGRRHSLLEPCRLHLTHQERPSIVLSL